MWALGEAFAAAPVIGLDNDTLIGRRLVAVRLGVGDEGVGLCEAHGLVRVCVHVLQPLVGEGIGGRSPELYSQRDEIPVIGSGPARKQRVSNQSSWWLRVGVEHASTNARTLTVVSASRRR